MQEFATTDKTALSRAKNRGSYDEKTIHAILDEAMICQAGFVRDGYPVVLPLAYGRENNRVYLHGAKDSPFMQQLGSGENICLSVFLLDGLVLAKSAFHHSVNFRSVVMFGKGVRVVDYQEKMHALKVITNHVIKNRWDKTRLPTQKEVDITAVISFEITEASAKTRSGPPVEKESDSDFPLWSGVINLETVYRLIQAKESFTEPEIELVNYRRG